MIRLIVVLTFLLLVNTQPKEQDMSKDLPCFLTKCPTEWGKCMTNKKCLSALKTCESRCSDEKSCVNTCLVEKGSQ